MIRCKAGDSVKQVTLKRGAGAVDLTDATSVAFRFKPHPSGTFASGTCTILFPRTDGAVQFAVPAAGRYDAEFEPTYSDSKHETVPNVLYDTLIVYPKLAA